MESAFALNVLQKPGHYITIRIFSVLLQGVADSESRFIFIDISAYGKQLMLVHFLLLLYITSWKVLNLLYQSLQVLREVEHKCLSSSFVMRPIL